MLKVRGAAPLPLLGLQAAPLRGVIVGVFHGRDDRGAARGGRRGLAVGLLLARRVLLGSVPRAAHVAKRRCTKAAPTAAWYASRTHRFRWKLTSIPTAVMPKMKALPE